MKIKRIYTQSFDGEVYNFHCTPNENYFSENVLVHNCYKTNTDVGGYMSLEDFKLLFGKLPKTLNQIAFGIGSIEGCPSLWDIMHYTRDNGIIPNITVNGTEIDRTMAKRLAEVCGAVAVSRYNSDTCYNAVKNLNDAGLDQVNIHQVLAHETYKSCLKLVGEDVPGDSRLEGLKAVVFLLLKPKGGRNKLNHIGEQSRFTKIVNLAREKGVSIGMDSCSAPLMLQTAMSEGMEHVIPSVEPCESTLFSSYFNYKGEFFPCSFTEGTPGWEEGIKVAEETNFLKDIWFSPKTSQWRNRLMGMTDGCKDSCAAQKHCRACPIYEITPCLK